MDKLLDVFTISTIFKANYPFVTTTNGKFSSIMKRMLPQSLLHICNENDCLINDIFSMT